MKIKHIFPIAIGLIFVFFACKKEPVFNGEHDPEVIKNYHNEAAAVSMMDSLASVNFIAKQKLTEIYELSSLYSSNSGDSIMKGILYPQMRGYFLENDSVNIAKILYEMDSLKVHFIEINGLDYPQSDSLDIDSVKVVNYGVRYYSADRKLIDSLRKSAAFILKKEPKKFKHEFIFYFTDLNSDQEANDTISSPVTQ